MFYLTFVTKSSFETDTYNFLFNFLSINSTIKKRASLGGLQYCDNRQDSVLKFETTPLG